MLDQIQIKYVEKIESGACGVGSHMRIFSIQASTCQLEIKSQIRLQQIPRFFLQLISCLFTPQMETWPENYRTTAIQHARELLFSYKLRQDMSKTHYKRIRATIVKRVLQRLHSQYPECRNIYTDKDMIYVLHSKLIYMMNDHLDDQRYFTARNEV
ncbi:Hypothetical_protein [Hexamita inflata]|uniref:Hypothetical_protein n=1 Tax=Hexamita inflata TaxID=28002 RepID=A0AA86R2A4_9EUKA|nr:Hypothetical protein HINF_LOCUS58024 [Hexamita inflata]